ncbi:MAG TPA: DNA (cytosine-5-)-methyltransferase [Ferruginibacter sp.]|nr:DNA (cytosine-5-)-methyltransferase [Ferruginibacter sp.]
MNNTQIPIIDLFAGPGGLGEGFTSIVDKDNKRFFKIALSIEKDEFAHKTLTLRSFLRQFPYGKFPGEYYDFLKSEEKDVEILYKKYPVQAANAKHEAWQFELGKSENHALIDKRIRESLNGKKDFLLIGGPPCQAYSLVGRARRQEGLGLNKEDPRVYLYREYYRILAVHKPPVFIMENVKGILSSKVENEGVFNQLINDLRNPVESYKKLQGQEKISKSRTEYKIYSLVRRADTDIHGEEIFRPEDFIIRSEQYGIPQTRHRVILLGVRNDLKIIPEILEKAKGQIDVDDVLSGLPNIRSGLSKEKDSKLNWKKAIEELLLTDIENQIDKEVWKKMKGVIDNLSLPQKDKGSDYLEYTADIKYNKSWFLDDKSNGVSNHESRSHIREDLYRYLFVSCFAKTKGRSPKLSDFPPGLLPKHLNASEGKFADRFRVQLYGQPSKTITSHISKDGHYFIHPDSSQCRSLTVREAARIQTFPDNYFFCGPRTQQFHQVGNAVPPLLAYQISLIVKNILEK